MHYIAHDYALSVKYNTLYTHSNSISKIHIIVVYVVNCYSLCIGIFGLIFLFC